MLRISPRYQHLFCGTRRPRRGFPPRRFSDLNLLVVEAPGGALSRLIATAATSGVGPGVTLKTPRGFWRRSAVGFDLLNIAQLVFVSAKRFLGCVVRIALFIGCSSGGASRKGMPECP